jgi:hypothetical protein
MTLVLYLGSLKPGHFEHTYFLERWDLRLLQYNLLGHNNLLLTPNILRKPDSSMFYPKAKIFFFKTTMLGISTTKMFCSEWPYVNSGVLQADICALVLHFTSPSVYRTYEAVPWVCKVHNLLCKQIITTYYLINDELVI